MRNSRHECKIICSFRNICHTKGILYVKLKNIWGELVFHTQIHMYMTQYRVRFHTQVHFYMRIGPTQVQMYVILSNFKEYLGTNAKLYVN